MTGWFLFISGAVVQKKWGAENELEFKINAISLLSEVRGRLIKGLKVNINLNDLTYELMEKLESITAKYKGEAKLYIEVLDQQENISLELFSKKIKVDPSAELIKELKLMPEVAYKIMDR
jgi:DNA polymerase-3 subunit alpha